MKISMIILFFCLTLITSLFAQTQTNMPAQSQPVQVIVRAPDPTVSENINNFKSRVNASVSSASFQLENAKNPEYFKSSSNRYNFCVTVRLAILALDFYSALKPGVDSFLVNTISDKLIQSGLGAEQVRGMSLESLISRFQGVLTIAHGNNCSM